MIRANQKGSLFLIIGIIVLLIIIGVGAFYSIYSKKTTEQQNTVSDLVISTNPTATPSPVSQAANINSKENINAINANVKLSYLFDPKDNEKLIYKEVDFNSHTIKEVVLPYISYGADDETKSGKYKISKDGKYIARILTQSMEVSAMPDIKFKKVFSVPPVYDKSGKLNYAKMGDIYWDNSGHLYFTTSVGLDGVGAPDDGPYTDLYIANSDGSNPKLINNHTRPDQNYGFMKSFNKVDDTGKRIFFGGSSHGGHRAVEQIVDAQSGKLLGNFQQIYSDYSNLIFNKDFSKAYVGHNKDYSDGNNPIDIIEYDLNTKSVKSVYKVPDYKKDSTTPIDINSGDLYMNTPTNTLYFQVRNDKKIDFYQLNLSSGQAIKLFDRGDGECYRIGVSRDDDYIFRKCLDEYQFYQVSTGKTSVFYTVEDNIHYEPTIQMINLN